MSIICPCLVTKIRLPICFCSWAFFIKKDLSLSSLSPFILDESKIIFLDCFSARLILRSNLSGLLVKGDFNSWAIPSNKKSAVLIFASGKNSTLCPAIAKISAILSSCGQGLRPPGIIILPRLFFLTIKYIITRGHKKWWFRLDLNQWHKALQASALPTELQNHFPKL